MPEDGVSRVAEIRETFFLEEGLSKLQLDKENMVLRNVKFLGNKSRNGRDYTEKAKSDYARLSEGESIYEDHLVRGSNGSRRVREFIGNGRNKRVEATGVYGDWHYTRRVAELVEDVVERGLTGVGMSLSGSGRQTKSGGRMIVEEYLKHSSTDFVANPATVDSLAEQVENEEVTDFESDKEGKSELNESQFNEAISGLTAEVAKLSEQLEEQRQRAEEAEKRSSKLQEVQEAIEASGKEVPQAVRKALELMESRKDMDSLLEAFSTKKAENKPAPTKGSDPISEGSRGAEDVVGAIFEAVGKVSAEPGNVVLGVRK